MKISEKRFFETFPKWVDVFLPFGRTKILPLQLISINEITNAKTGVWKNPRPPSPRFCRPPRIQFVHETTEATITEVDNIKKQVDKLVLFHKIVDEKEFSVSYKLAFTMLDGKVCNAITGTESTQRCYLYDSTSKDFNKIEEILQKEVSNKKIKIRIVHIVCLDWMFQVFSACII